MKPSAIAKELGVSVASVYRYREGGGKEQTFSSLVLTVLFLGLSVFAPPSGMSGYLREGDPVVWFPSLCATFTLIWLGTNTSINKYLMRKGILIDPSKKD